MEDPLGLEIVPPPAHSEALHEWARALGIERMLDAVALGTDHAPLPAYLVSGVAQVVTFAEVFDLYPRAREAASRKLVDFARAHAHQQQARRAWLNAKPPSDPVLGQFFDWLSAGVAARPEAVRPPGQHMASPVSLQLRPAPSLEYTEEDLCAPPHQGVRVYRLPLRGWEAETPRLVAWQARAASANPVDPAVERAALQAFVSFVCDSTDAAQLQRLRQVLASPGWTYLLQELDQELDALELQAPAGPDTRVAFRVVGRAPDVTVEPVVQKRRKGGDYSAGARIDWRALRQMGPQLQAEDVAVLRAYFDPLVPTQGPYHHGHHATNFSCLLAAREHPRVYREGPPARPMRIDHATLTMRMVEDEQDHLTPVCDVAGLTLPPSHIKAAARDGQHVILQDPDDDAHLVLCTLNQATAALVRAFASAPVRIAPAAKEDLLARLAPVQPFVDVELPRSWTGEMRAADVQIVVRLLPQHNGGLHVALGVRPLPGGPVWPAGEGPSVVIGGVYQQRHSVHRDFAQEAATVAKFCEAAGLARWPKNRDEAFEIPPGDDVFEFLEKLQTEHAPSADQGVQVEWPKEGPLLRGAELGRGDLRLRVNTQRSWFDVDGEAITADGDKVRLAELLTAAREGRKYVLVAGRRFYKLKKDLRALLVIAAGDLSADDVHLKVSRQRAAGFVGLLDDPDQVKADAAFVAFRTRVVESHDVEPAIGPELIETLRPYQHEGVRFLVRLSHWGAGAVLADDMGLGKTLQALAVLQHRAAAGPALVVAPTSVVSNWMDEAARFAPDLKFRAYRDSARAALLDRLGPHDVVVTSYAIAARDAEELAKVRFTSLVLDEAQAIKNAATDRAAAIRGLHAEWTMALTGTPIENHLSELWSLMHTVAPGLLGSWQRFRAVFAVPIERYGDTNRRHRLSQIIRPFVLRRRKSEVARELPPRTIVVRKVQLSPLERRHYEALRAATLDALSKKRGENSDTDDVRMMLLAALLRLRQLVCHPRLVHPDAPPSSTKLEELLRIVLDLRQSGSRALVFSQFRSFLDLVQPALDAAGVTTLRLDGTTPASARAERVQRFQEGHADVFLISLKAGGVGLNLTMADTVIHLDPWWNPAVEDQASDRAHRIGQTKPVTVVKLVGDDTVEEAVLALHEDKRDLIAGVLEGTHVAGALSVEDLVALIRRGR